MNFSYDIKKLAYELNPIFTKLMKKVQSPANADKHYSCKVEITEILKPFNHITLDEKYKIIAYSSKEIHGVYGKAVAIEKDKETPDACYPVNEAIFCDGTPEGFLKLFF